jgi:hypothetical protein
MKAGQDTTGRGRTLKRDIDGQMENLMECGLQPTDIVMDLGNYQVWAEFQMIARCEDNPDPWELHPPAPEAELAYRECRIIPIVAAEPLVRVTCDPTEIWNNAEAFIAAMKEFAAD